MYLVLIYAQQIKALVPEDGQLCTADQESTGLRPALLCLILRLFTPNQGFEHQKAKGLSLQKVKTPRNQQLPL